MNIGINASYSRKPDSGIGQVTTNFVKELIKLENSKPRNADSKHPEAQYFLYLETDIDLKLPKNIRKRVFLPALWRRDDLFRKIWWEKFLLPRIARRDKCDVFISLYQCPTVFKGAKHKMIVHDMIPRIFPEYLDNWRKKIYSWLTYRAAKSADEIITVSEWSKKDIHKFLKITNGKISVAHPSVGDEFFTESNWDHDNKILEKYGVYGRYIFYIGGFDFRKNVTALLEGYKKMMERYEINEVSLVLGGEDKSKFSPLFTDVKKEITDLGLEGKAKLIGFVEQKDLPALYRNAELYVLPSLYEGFGLMPLEAMASGTPVAVSKSSALPEIGGDAALYFNPYEPEEIARVMSKVLRNSKLHRHLGEKGEERAKKFSWKSFVDTVLA